MNDAWYTWHAFYAGLYLLAGVAFVGLAAWSAFGSRPTVEVARGYFMQETGAYLDPSFLSNFDAWRSRSRRIHALSLLTVGVVLLLLSSHAEVSPIVVMASLSSLIVLPESVGRLRAAGREFVVPHGRGAVARPRRVVLSDYVPVRDLVLTWSSVGIVVVIGVGALVRRHEMGVAGPIIVEGAAVIFGVAVFTAWFGWALCVRPTPAVDASHLYLQDAWRAQALEQIHLQLRLSAFPFTAAALDGAHDPVGLPLDIGLGICAAAIALGSLFLQKQHFRKRLWPTLEPGQVLLPGEPVPPRQVGATA